MRYAELNFLIPRDHLHSKSAGESKCLAERRRRRVEVFGRAAAPESRSVRQSSGAGDPKRWQRVVGVDKAAAAKELKRGH